MVKICWCSDNSSLKALSGLVLIKMMLVSQALDEFTDDDDDLAEECYGMNCKFEGDIISVDQRLAPDGIVSLSGYEQTNTLSVVSRHSFDISCDWQRGCLHGPYIFRTLDQDGDEYSILTISYINFNRGMVNDTILYSASAVVNGTNYVTSITLKLLCGNEIHYKCSCPLPNVTDVNDTVQLAQLQKFIHHYQELDGYELVTTSSSSHLTTTTSSH